MKIPYQGKNIDPFKAFPLKTPVRSIFYNKKFVPVSQVTYLNEKYVLISKHLH